MFFILEFVRKCIFQVDCSYWADITQSQTIKLIMKLTSREIQAKDWKVNKNKILFIKYSSKRSLLSNQPFNQEFILNIL